jgi:hypothetical protein
VLDAELAARDAGIEQIALQHGVVPRHDRDHHRRAGKSASLSMLHDVVIRQVTDFHCDKMITL